MSDVGRRLMEVRDYLGFDPNFVAERVGISPERLAALESGAAAPDALELRRLARLYEYPVRHFEGPEPEPEPVPALARLADQLGPRDREEAYRFAQYLRYAGEAD